MALARNRIPPPPPPPPPARVDGPPLSTGELAHMMGCSIRHAAMLADTAGLPSWRVGTHRRVDFGAFVEWANRRGIVLRDRPARANRKAREQC